MIFVTGGTGLVGARLIFDLVKKGKQVTALIREGTPINKVKALMRYYTENVDEIIDTIQWVQGDITDKELLFNVINEGMEVYHCAGFVSFSSKDKDKIEEINVEGTANIVESCLFNKAKKLCHVSSIGALGGGLNGEPATEDSPWSAGKKTAYSLSKYASEMEVWRGIAEGLDAVIVNPAVILGPGNWKTGSPQIFNRVANGMAFFTFGSTSYVDVRDVSDAMIQLMESNINEERFILAAKTLTHKELFTKIALALGKKRLPQSTLHLQLLN